MTEPAPPHRQPEENPRHGRLAARPTPPTAEGDTGLLSLPGPQRESPALAYVPAGGDGAYRLVVHGAGGSARQGLDLLLPLADAHRLLLLAPQATASSWDLIFVAHGTDDRVLPVDPCSRRLVPRLRSLGHPVEYGEFAGGHEVPAAIREQATEWLTGERGSG